MKRNFTSLLLFLNFVCLFDISIIAQKIAAGGRHSLSICTDSTVQAWGYNGFGQLGNGSIVEQTSGTKVVGLSSIVILASLDTDNAHIGQQVILTYKLYTSTSIDNIEIVSQPNLDKFSSQNFTLVQEPVITEVK